MNTKTEFPEYVGVGNICNKCNKPIFPGQIIIQKITGMVVKDDVGGWLQPDEQAIDLTNEGSEIIEEHLDCSKAKYIAPIFPLKVK